MCLFPAANILQDAQPLLWRVLDQLVPSLQTIDILFNTIFMNFSPSDRQQEHNSSTILLLRALKEYMFHQDVPTSLLAYVTATEAFIAQS